MQDVALAILRQHEADGELPTNGRFVFYEAEGQGHVRKSRRGESRRGSADNPREQELTDALTYLRDHGIVPWDWLTDETRTLYDWEHAPSVYDFVLGALDRASINPWDAEPPPLVLMESRSLGGVLRTDVSLYCCSLNWRRVAITDAQIAEHRLTPIWKTDSRYRPPREHEAIECEALGQGVVRTLLLEALDTLLPEPLLAVWDREDAQREVVREMLAQFDQ